MAQLTIKQAIEMGLTTQAKLTKDATQFKLQKVVSLYKESLVRQTMDLLDKETLSEFGYFSTWHSITYYLRKPEDLHTVRSELRKQLGSWNDEIYTTCVSGTDLIVTYRTTNKDQFPVDFSIEVSYPLDNLPDGLLKPTCKIVEKTEYSIECEVS